VSDRLLDQKLLRRAFELLAKHLKRRGVVGEVHVFGGAAMVLAFNSRQATRDVDAVFAPDTYVLEAAREVAVELGLPKSWLNNQASSYVSGVAGRGTPVFDHSNLRVMVTPIEHLLAMKVRAARAVRDADDIRVLLNELKFTKVSQVIAVVNKYFANEPLSERSSQLLEDILST
jgi:hypothetical protein